MWSPGTKRFLDGRLRTPSPKRKERRFERLEQENKEHDKAIVVLDAEVKRVVGTRNHMADIQVKKQVNRFTELPQVPTCISNIVKVYVVKHCNCAHQIPILTGVIQRERGKFHGSSISRHFI